MDTRIIGGVPVSAFTLGTVQLGMDYGLTGRTAKPTEAEAFAVLDRAAALGVRTLDTANNYGDSERLIGRWLRRRGDRPAVVTKIGPLDHSSPRALRADILRQTEASLRQLGLERLDLLMVHDFDDYARDPATVRDAFAGLQADGLIRLRGLSAYSRHDYGVLADSGFDAVQIPLNVFDWARIDDGGVGRLADAGMAIFVRSVFLQGLVFCRPEELDRRMDFCVPYLERYLRLCGDFGMTPAVLALSFALSVPGVTSAVLGCQTPEQAADNCRLFEQAVPLDRGQMDRLHRAFRDVDPRVVNPGCWYNHT